MRMADHDVLMVSGTDEHGTPILVAADNEGVPRKSSPTGTTRSSSQDLVDLGLSYDLFTRTTTGNHYLVAQEMFKTVHRNGYMVEQTTHGAISPSTGRTLPDRYIEGTCPICGYADARGDQCDNCGNQLDADRPDQPAQQDQRRDPGVRRDPALLPRPAGACRGAGEWLDEREASGTWRPNVINFSKNFLEDIRPRAMTRDIDWGIPVPLDGWRDQPTKRLYVWFDAVIGYLSASIEWARRPGEPERWRDWWNDPEALSYYFMGKDNIVFHSQIWPAELLAYDGEGDRGGEPGEYGGLNLPTEVVSSEFLTMESKQFSTSRGHVLYVGDLLARYQPDALRYFICAAGPGDLRLRLHLGGVRAAHQLRAGRGLGQPGQPHRHDGREELRRDPARGSARAGRRGGAGRRRAGFDAVGELLGRHRQRAAIAEAMRVVGEVNKYLTVTEPYKMKDESQRERLATVLHVAAQCVLDCNTLLAPFLPFSANKVWTTFGGEGEFMPMPRIEHVEDLDPGHGAGLTSTRDHRRLLRHAGVGAPPVTVGATVEKPTPIFTKLDPSVVDEELARLA